MDLNHRPRPYLAPQEGRSYQWVDDVLIIWTLWGKMDLNHRPRPYKDRALTKLSYCPGVVNIKLFRFIAGSIS